MKTLDFLKLKLRILIKLETTGPDAIPDNVIKTPSKQWFSLTAVINQGLEFNWFSEFAKSAK